MATIYYSGYSIFGSVTTNATPPVTDGPMGYERAGPQPIDYPEPTNTFDAYLDEASSAWDAVDVMVAMDILHAQRTSNGLPSRYMLIDEEAE